MDRGKEGRRNLGRKKVHKMEMISNQGPATQRKRFFADVMMRRSPVCQFD